MFASNLRLVCERSISAAARAAALALHQASQRYRSSRAGPQVNTRHYHFIASSPSAITEQSAASHLRLLGPLLYLPGHRASAEVGLEEPRKATGAHRLPLGSFEPLGQPRVRGPVTPEACRKTTPQGQGSRTIPWNPVGSVGQSLALG